MKNGILFFKLSFHKSASMLELPISFNGMTLIFNSKLRHKSQLHCIAKQLSPGSCAEMVSFPSSQPTASIIWVKMLLWYSVTVATNRKERETLPLVARWHYGRAQHPIFWLSGLLLGLPLPMLKQGKTMLVPWRPFVNCTHNLIDNGIFLSFSLYCIFLLV